MSDIVEIMCKGCEGTGQFNTKHLGVHFCEACHGNGILTFSRQPLECWRCHGRGYESKILQGEYDTLDGDIECLPVIAHLPCQQCNGSGWIRRTYFSQITAWMMRFTP